MRRVWSRGAEREVDAELAFHLEERVAELISAGRAPDAARAEALREFGDVAAVRAGLVAIDAQIANRRSWRERTEWIGQDLRYVVRALTRSPGFVVTVSLTLALGIGANAAIFSLLDRLFLRAPAGITRPESVHRIYRLDPARASRRVHIDDVPGNSIDVSSVFSYDDFAVLVQTAPRSAQIGGYTTDARKLRHGGEAVSLRVQYVLGDFFGVVGVQPAHGRLFQADES